MASNSPKIAVYSLPDLKNTTDDALPNYLTSIGFSQSQLLSNLRLALQGVMVAIGAAAFYLDYTQEWSQTKGITFWAVGAYFALSTVVTGLVFFVESGLVFQGNFRGESLTIRTRVDKHDPTYHVTFTSSSAGNTTVSVPFSTFFDSEGHFVAPPFQSWLAGSIPLIATADPGRAKIANERGEQLSSTSGQEVEAGQRTPMKRQSGKK